MKVFRPGERQFMGALCFLVSGLFGILTHGYCAQLRDALFRCPICEPRMRAFAYELLGMTLFVGAISLVACVFALVLIVPGKEK